MHLFRIRSVQRKTFLGLLERSVHRSQGTKGHSNTVSNGRTNKAIHKTRVATIGTQENGAICPAEIINNDGVHTNKSRNGFPAAEARIFSAWATELSGGQEDPAAQMESFKTRLRKSFGIVYHVPKTRAPKPPPRQAQLHKSRKVTFFVRKAAFDSKGR